MKKVITLLVLLLSLLLTGCTVTADRIYAVCRVDGNNTFVFNEKGEFFKYVNKQLVKCSGANLQAKPKLTVYLPEEPTFVLNPEIPSVYTGTKDDALGYIAHVMLSTGAEVQCPKVDWRSFEAYLRNDELDMRVIYTVDDKVRIYATDKEGNAIKPPYLD